MLRKGQQPPKIQSLPPDTKAEKFSSDKNAHIAVLPPILVLNRPRRRPLSMAYMDQKEMQQEIQIML